MKQLILFFAIVLIIPSCSIEKRHYRNGFNYSWNSNNKNSVTRIKQVRQNDTDSISSEKGDDATVASVSDELFLAKESKSSVDEQLDLEECDIIILKNGDEIKAKVTDISSTEIKYKKCDEPNGQTYYYKASEVFMIKYPNGSKEIIKSTENTSKDASNLPENIKGQGNANTTKKNDAKPKTPNSGSQTASGAKLKISKLSLFGFLFSMIAFLFFCATLWQVAAAFAAIGFVLSVAGLIQIKKHRDVYKGKFLSAYGIIFGLIILIGALVLSILISCYDSSFH